MKRAPANEIYRRADPLVICDPLQPHLQTQQVLDSNAAYANHARRAPEGRAANQNYQTPVRRPVRRIT